MRVARGLILMGVGLVAACGGGGGDDGGTGPAPVFTTLAVQPASPVNITVGGTQALTVTARDQSNNAMSGLTSTFASSDETKATVNGSGVITGVAAGTARITVTGTIGSVSKTATVDVNVAPPGATAAVTATTGSQFVPGSVTITRNGTVTWTFQALHNVTFDAAAGVPTNIDDKSTGTDSRSFPTAGTYTYYCTIHGRGMNGTVVVQ